MQLSTQRSELFGDDEVVLSDTRDCWSVYDHLRVYAMRLAELSHMISYWPSWARRHAVQVMVVLLTSRLTMSLGWPAYSHDSNFSLPPMQVVVVLDAAYSVMQTFDGLHVTPCHVAQATSALEGLCNSCIGLVRGWTVVALITFSALTIYAIMFDRAITFGRI